MAESQTSLLSALLPVELRLRLEQLAAEHDRSVSAEERTAIRRYVEDRGLTSFTAETPGRGGVPDGSAPAGETDQRRS